MIETQNFDKYPVFGEGAAKTSPDQAKYSGGFQAADVLPAEWLNWAWAKNSKGISDLNAGVAAMEAELNAVLEAGGIVANNTGGQVVGAIKKIILEKTGTLTNLNTTNKETIVAACNELLSQIRKETQQRQEALTSLSRMLFSHADNKGNPHGVTAAQVGLGNVNNTPDNEKSVKYAQTAGSAKADGGNADTVGGFKAGNHAGMLVPVVAFNAGENAGYIKLGNGLIVQWGTTVPSHGEWATTIFPLSFATTKYAIVATKDNNTGGGSSDYDIRYFNKQKSRVDWYTMREAWFSWIAIGI